MKSLVSKAQLIEDFNDAQKGFIDSVNQSMEYAFQMGDILIQLKEIIPHGQFESVLKNEARFAFGIRYAQTLMKVAKNKAYILEHNSGEMLSVREMERIVSKKPSKQPESAAAIDDAAAAKSQPSPGQAGKEEIIEGEYTDVSNAEPEPARPALPEPELMDDEEEYSDDDRASDLIDDLIRENQQLEEDNNRMRVIFEDDNYTAAAIKQIDALKEVEKGLQGRIDSLLNENAEMKRQLNRLDRRNKVLEKKLKEAGHE